MAARFLIDGGIPLRGEVGVSAAKNAALPLLAASLLSEAAIVLENVPRLADVRTIGKLLGRLGAEVREEAGATVVQTPRVVSIEAPYELVSTMRASVLVLGPLVARAGRARVAMPGGCAIGGRPIDLHLRGLERLGAEELAGLRLGLLHGQMKASEKERVMDGFRSGRTHLLISTTVIEVGVDVPNATVMLVENAERFGLAQLHQLRGRIGRGTHPSTCVLFDESEEGNLEARARLEAMVRTTDGFELADEDLRLRGEGTLFDVKQSGLPDLKLARLADDLDLVKRARARAFAAIDRDPDLAGEPGLLAELRSRFEGSIDWLFHS